MKRTLLILLLIQTIAHSKNIQREQILMGTFVKITLEEKNKDEIQKGFKLIREIEKSLSSYDNTALLYQLNQEKSIEADVFLKEAIKKSIDLHKKTFGYFDISIGSLTKKLYRFGEKENIPSKNELAKARLNIDGIVLNEHNITLEKHLTLDLGGMGKGYAVDKVADYYKEQNITKGTISLSGDIRCLDVCNFSIQSPFEKHKTLMELKSKNPNLSISTSGTYRRYIKEKEHHHLINPKTKTQGRTFVSVSLFTYADNSTIDAFATAVSVMSKVEALDFLSQYPNIGYILVEPNKTIIRGQLSNFLLQI